MDFTLSTLRSSLQHPRLQSPDIIFWFEHTAFPLLATRSHPHDYLQHKRDQLEGRRLTGITTGFATKGDGLQNGFTPISFNPPLFETLREIRVVRFIPDSGEISHESIMDKDETFSALTMSCKIKSAAVVAKIGDANENEREMHVEDLFDLQITLHSRKIEF